MYRELGGRSEYLKTPMRELQELQASITEEWNYQAELDAERQREMEEQKAEMERQKREQQTLRGRTR